jgi:uncharacterized membrane protein
MSHTIRLFTYLLPLVALSGVLLTSTAVRAQPGALTFQSMDVPDSVATELDNINSQGEIVGFFVDRSGRQHGVMIRQGVFTQLDFPGAISTRTVGLNNRGDVVGSFIDGSGIQHGLILTNGRFMQLDFPGASGTQPEAVNDEGDIVGGFTDIGGHSVGHFKRPHMHKFLKDGLCPGIRTQCNEA